jgi:hypothetical protein
MWVFAARAATSTKLHGGRNTMIDEKAVGETSRAITLEDLGHSKSAAGGGACETERLRAAVIPTKSSRTPQSPASSSSSAEHSAEVSRLSLFVSGRWRATAPNNIVKLRCSRAAPLFAYARLRRRCIPD